MPSTHAVAALAALTSPGTAIADAARSVPAWPGLYAISGAPMVWQDLGLGAPPDARPLYVGKSESSLASRDVRTHFATGRTGTSTVRRSLVGLRANDLRLRGQPRNLVRPGYFANVGLDNAGDQRLTAWMRLHLRLAVWVRPKGVVLDRIETEVLLTLVPPLNLSEVGSPWQQQVRAGRMALAAQVRKWSP